MPNYDYQIAIPSYKRPQRIAETALAYLDSTNIDMSRVTVFLADEEESEAYRKTLERFPGVRTAVGCGKGLANARNAINDHYPAGTRLMEIDDDVLRIWEKTGEDGSNEMKHCTDLEALIAKAFDAANGTLWCIYPNKNPFFMKRDKIRTSGLWYAEGAVFGYVVQHRPYEYVDLDHGEDYLRSLQFFEAHGAVTRIDGYGAQSRYWDEPGGLQEIRTPELISQSLKEIEARYPHLTTLYYDKKGRPNLRLKVIR